LARRFILNQDRRPFAFGDFAGVRAPYLSRNLLMRPHRASVGG
jgi:hypothetical protein